ncbi:hypothetical protein HCN44_001198 [Aphidius gifuensis]|uniref:Uncharacterized protein n=1 Tax=Aphidius gifuensis TaxID=684658 RepID=A0A835CQ01_APHGI|nr:cyclic GMP-AMP synthase [Aphidius gifuensis]KAF7988625.1 hypothetical protein HCN44_001198 [Aphidius gifuensis]
MNPGQRNGKLRDNGTFDRINSFVTLKDDEIKKNNLMLNEVIESLIEAMKTKDDLFKTIYNRIMYTGSHYKGTKVGKPEEFDLDLILKLPVVYDGIKIEDVKERPGFARIIIDSSIKLPGWTKHEKTLNQWLDDEKYINNEKVRRWFEGIVSKCFSDFERGINKMYLLPSKKEPSVKYNVTSHKSGPAFTLIVQEKNTKFSVDLVPALEFNKNPPKNITKYSTDKPCWHLVPKPSRVGNKAYLDWRYCFSTYERKMLSKYGKYKPVIRQMKKLRDTQNWSSMIPSYYIETLFYHEFASGSTYPWCTNSYIEAFIYMLEQLQLMCKKKCLKYFWLDHHNLLDGITWDQAHNITTRLEKIIKDVKAQPSKLAEYVLTKEEFEQFEKMQTVKTTQTNPIKINELNDLSSMKISNVTNQIPNQSTCQLS